MAKLSNITTVSGFPHPSSPSFPLAGLTPRHRLLLHGGAEDPHQPAGFMRGKALGTFLPAGGGMDGGVRKKAGENRWSSWSPFPTRSPGFLQHLVVSAAIINLQQ